MQKKRGLGGIVRGMQAGIRRQLLPAKASSLQRLAYTGLWYCFLAEAQRTQGDLQALVGATLVANIGNSRLKPLLQIIQNLCVPCASARVNFFSFFYIAKSGFYT